MKYLSFLLLFVPSLLSSQTTLNEVSDAQVTLLENHSLKLFSPQKKAVNNEFSISFSNGHTLFHDGKKLLKSAITRSNYCEVYGGGGDDNLTVDFTGVSGMSIYYNGENNLEGTNGDILTIEQVTLDLAEHIFYNEHDGQVIAETNKIEYVGLEPVIDNLNAADRIFTFIGGTETIDIDDGFMAADNFLDINSSLGELVTFFIPTNSILIDADSGDDIVNINSAELASIPTISVNGGAGNNTLVVDAMGAAATDNGSVISIAGLYDINYTNFNTVTVVNSVPIPTLSQWGIIILSMLMVITGIITFSGSRIKGTDVELK